MGQLWRWLRASWWEGMLRVGGAMPFLHWKYCSLQSDPTVERQYLAIVMLREVDYPLWTVVEHTELSHVTEWQVRSLQCWITLISTSCMATRSVCLSLPLYFWSDAQLPSAIEDAALSKRCPRSEIWMVCLTTTPTQMSKGLWRLSRVPIGFCKFWQLAKFAASFSGSCSSRKIQ